MLLSMLAADAALRGPPPSLPLSALARFSLMTALEAVTSEVDNLALPLYGICLMASL